MGKRGAFTMAINHELYFVTAEATSTESLLEIIEAAVKGGVTMVQLREKKSPGKAFYERAEQVKRLLDRYQVPLLINDRIDIALAIGASGVHIGQSDLPLDVVRKLLPPSMIVGISVSTVEQAEVAEKQGADYIGVGAIFPTKSKENAKTLPEGRLTAITDAVKVPAVAIGGIQQDNIAELKGKELSGVAVVSAIMQAKDPEEAARALKEKWTSRSVLS